MHQALNELDEACPSRNRPRYGGETLSQSTQSSDTEETPSNTDHRQQARSAADNTRDQAGCTVSSQMEYSLAAESRDPAHWSNHDAEQLKSKRHEVRKALQYLKNECNPELLHVGDIPSSWSSHNGDEEDMLHNLRDIQDSPDPKTQDSSPGLIAFGDEGVRYPGAIDSNTVSDPPDSQQSDAISKTISESLLAPLDLEYEETSHERPEQGDSEDENIHERVKSRIRARMAAFRAAEEGSYDAWADISLVSAGDNHAEKEVELW